MPVAWKRVSWVLGCTLMLVVATLLAGMAHSAAQVEHDVNVGDFFFDPADVEIAVGDTVRWMQSGLEPHDIVAVDGSFNSHPDCDFGSGTCMQEGDVFEWTFTQPGEFAYYCSLHGTPSGLGMAGTVIVAAAETGAIEGTVTDAGTGAPIEGASVTAGGEPTTTGADGSYTLELDAGDHTVTASADGYEAASRPATVTAGETTVVGFALAAEAVGEGPTVTGVWNNHFETVTDGVFVQWDQPIDAEFPAGGPGPAGYTLHQAPDCSDAAIAVGAEGFWTSTRPGLRDLIMDDWSSVTYGDTYYLGVATGTESGTDSEAPSQEACFEFVAELSVDHQSTFAGQVTDAGTGAPVAGATVTVTRTVGAPGTVAGHGTTDGDGTYVVDHLAPGPYEVTADADGYEALTQEAAALRMETVEVDFALQSSDGPGTGAIAGTVTDGASGDPIAGATVTADDEETTTAADGSYLIDDLQPGEYAVTARADDYLFTSTRTRTVTEGETTTVDFALDPAVPVTVGPTVALDLVAEGLTAPVQVLSAPDGSGRLFIVDQVGLIRIVSADGELLEEPFLDLRDRMVAFRPGFDERGALGLAFHPDYATNGRLFVYYSAPLRPGAPEGWDHTSHISEFAVSADPDLADPASERIVLQVDQPQFNHDGGQVAFGPDGFLYISLGDGGGGNDTAMGHTPGIGNAQDITNLLGSILRIDVDGREPYGIPADNPFVGAEGRDEIFAYGFRNPYRFSFDQGGDHALLVGDAGQGLWEEVNLVTKGGNYGWNVKEGTHCFNPEASSQMPEECPDVGPRGEPLIDPIIEYPHANQPGGIGAVVVGGYVYRGSDVPALEGQYLFGDWSTSFGAPDGTLLVAEPGATGLWPIQEVAIKDRPDGRLGHYLLGFGQDADGEVYVLTSDSVSPSGDTGRVYRIASDADAGAIAGTVVEADSGDPIAGATVAAAGQSTTTAADGSYMIDDVEAGTHTVTASAAGYAPASQTAMVADGETTTADFALEADEPEPEPTDDPQSKGDCMKGGWRDYGFKNQGQCIRFVQTGKDSR